MEMGEGWKDPNFIMFSGMGTYPFYDWKTFLSSRTVNRYSIKHAPYTIVFDNYFDTNNHQ